MWNKKTSINQLYSVHSWSHHKTVKPNTIFHKYNIQQFAKASASVNCCAIWNTDHTFELTTDIPYLALTDKLWGVSCDFILFFVENWQCCNVTAIYTAFIDRHISTFLTNPFDPTTTLVSVCTAGKMNLWSVPCWAVRKKKERNMHSHFTGLVVNYGISNTYVLEIQ